MVVSSAKLTILISSFLICMLFILLSTIMKFASTSAAIMYSSMESGQPWRTPRLRVKGSDRRTFIFILDWMLLQRTFIMWIKLSPYLNFFKARKMKSKSNRSKASRKSSDITDNFLFSLLDKSTISRIVESVLRIVLFLIAAV